MKNLLFILLFIPLISFGQNNKGIQMCLALQSNGFISNLEAEEALDLIMNVSGLNKNFILAPCDNIENAYAIRFNNERYIIYDKDFMDEIDGVSKWRNLTILAHEVAHHLNNHPLEVRLANSADRKSLAEKRRQELEADEFAGFIMARLDGPLKEVLAAVSSISNNKDDTYSTHPSRDKRINAIRKGYKRAGYIENFSWFNWEVPDFFKKIQNIFLGESDNKIEKKEKTNEKVYSNRNVVTSIDTKGYVPSMVFVEGGSFTMGCSSEQSDCFNDEKPAHRVKLSSFSMSSTEVTQAQYQRVMGNNPSFNKADKNPVEMASWNDAVTYCKKLSGLTGKRFRLPTEAEWEYAARGGQKSKGYQYAGSNSIDYAGWYSNNSGNKTHEVGQKLPNELGLHDMTGNVSEWCSDRYGKDYYKSSTGNNPTGEATGADRVLRSASYGADGEYSRVAHRGHVTPDDRYASLGFRVVSY